MFSKPTASRIAVASGSLALAATALLVPAAQASTSATQGRSTQVAAVAPQAFQQPVKAAACNTRDVYISGAEAHWTKCESAGYTQVNGWVKDTAADGKCAQVYAMWSEGAYHESERACPKGSIRYYYWNERGTVSVYLRKVG